ncbi:uncharacterized protein LOC142233782 [Haematobia irritans]|uniref:uncharacterized protein LOC142233782 n=1 Tax=Haematobia irritans TaxID=7368 RepID=UPI003F50AACB
MRTFIVLCFVAVACAQYNYQPASQGAEEGFSGASDGGFVGGADAGGSQSGGDFGHAVSHDAPAVAPQAEFEKEFFSYTADDNDFNDNNAAEQAANSLKQALRVVFIKGPENRGLENAALALAKQAGEQKTAIYVLNKQADIGDLANKLNSINHSGNSKPEVHFVKYRTAEDAANAQRTIQSQYDGLGGNTRSINGGVAPVLNFASQAPAATTSNYGSAGAIEAPTNSYIPPSSAAPSNSYVPPPAAPTNSYIPPSTAPAAPANTYVPPAPTAAAPTNSYIPPATPVDEPSPNYLPASILRLFRL